MSFEPREYLRHILAEADYLIGKSRGLEAEAFAKPMKPCDGHSLAAWK